MRSLARFWELTNLGLPLASGRFQRARALYWRCVGACHSGAAGAGKACCVSLEPLHTVWISACSAGDQVDVCCCRHEAILACVDSLFSRNGLCAKPVSLLVILLMLLLVESTFQEAPNLV